MQNSHKVSKDCFPNPNFELMQEVHDKQDEQVESKPREFLWERVLVYDQDKL